MKCFKIISCAFVRKCNHNSLGHRSSFQSVIVAACKLLVLKANLDVKENSCGLCPPVTTTKPGRVGSKVIDNAVRCVLGMCKRFNSQIKYFLRTQGVTNKEVRRRASGETAYLILCHEKGSQAAGLS